MSRYGDMVAVQAAVRAKPKRRRHLEERHEAIPSDTREHSWALHRIGLCCAWLLLLLTQAGLLVAVAHTYLLAVTQSEIPLGFSVFIKSVHPTVAILPVVIIVLWQVIPFEQRLSGAMNIAPRPTSGSRPAAKL